jgi:signal transduction histidine kinase
MYLGCLAVVFFRSTGAWKTLYLQWLGASLLYTVSSVLANVAIRNGTYYTGSLYDVPLTVAMAWYAGIALVAPTLPLKKQPSPAGHHQGVWAARLAMLAILSMPILAGVTMAMDLPVSVHTYRLRLTLGTILLMGSLVFLKQHLLDRELLRLLRSTQDNLEDVKRLQSQLVQSEKLASLGQLVGGAAHELNNPLTAVLGYAEILASTNPLTPDQRSLTDKIVQQVHRTKALVSSLLSFAKQVPGERTLLDLNSVARTALTQTKPHLRTRNIDVRTSLAVDLPLVLGDQNQLLQVCLHIINNALQALEEVGGGTLQIATGWDDGFASLEFSDNGPGAREPEKVFDPFYTTKGVGKGSGLGLSACYGIIQDHQGRILCRNRPEGGATFRIELPHSGSAKQAVLALADSKPKAGEEADRDVASATLSLPPAPR